MVRSRVEAIRVEADKAVISETLCSGCGICVKKCPFKAISIVNLPDELRKIAVTVSAQTASNFSVYPCLRPEQC